jgi:hypothetical protein
MYHIVYLTTNLVNNKIYVGVHSTYKWFVNIVVKKCQNPLVVDITMIIANSKTILSIDTFH